MPLGPILVKLADGSVFWCTVERVDELDEERWVFEASNGARHIGPPPAARYTPIEIQQLVERWYQEYRDLDSAPRDEAE